MLIRKCWWKSNCSHLNSWCKNIFRNQKLKWNARGTKNHRTRERKRLRAIFTRKTYIFRRFRVGSSRERVRNGRKRKRERGEGKEETLWMPKISLLIAANGFQLEMYLKSRTLTSHTHTQIDCSLFTQMAIRQFQHRSISRQKPNNGQLKTMAIQFGHGEKNFAFSCFSVWEYVCAFWNWVV